jgi:putative hydrolase of the HAD superfamily
MLDAVLFDLGDTLVDFGQLDHEALFAEAAKQTYVHLHRRGFRLPAYRRYHNAHHRAIRAAYIFSKLRRREFYAMRVVEKVLNRFGLRLNERELSDLAWLWYGPIRRRSVVPAGAAQMLADLRDGGLKLGIVSNTFIGGDCLDRHLAEEGLLDFFPTRLYSSHIGHQKPQKKIFQMALDELEVSAERTLFIGDLLRTDIRGGNRMGMKTIWKPAQHLPASPDAVHNADARITHLHELPTVLNHLGWRAQKSLERVNV